MRHSWRRERERGRKQQQVYKCMNGAKKMAPSEREEPKKLGLE